MIYNKTNLISEAVRRRALCTRRCDGGHYISAVFAYYSNVTAKRDIMRAQQYYSGSYFAVFDRDKKRLIKHCQFQVGFFIDKSILIIDSDSTGFVVNENGEGCVDFLSKELLDSILDSDCQPQDIIEKCRAIDSACRYEPVREIKTQKDITDLEKAVMNFLDVYINYVELLDDGALYLFMDGCWGCKVEIWFRGELEYRTSGIDDYAGKNWYSSTLLIHDGFIYFTDSTEIPVDEITNSHCHFKARHMKYKIIPD